MKKVTALKSILVIAVLGLLFSGYLSYKEFFPASGEIVGCAPIGTPGTIFGYPPCVYGFFMYLVVGVVAFLGLRGSKDN